MSTAKHHYAELLQSPAWQQVWGALRTELIAAREKVERGDGDPAETIKDLRATRRILDTIRYNFPEPFRKELQ